MSFSMDMYMVMDKSTHRKVGLDDYKHYPLNILIQHHNNEYLNLKKFNNSSLLIDSGAFKFNFYNKNQSSEKTYKYVEKYLSFIKKTKKDSRILGYFDMDLIYLGLPTIRKIRQILKNHSNKIIAVYHPAYGLNEFKRMCLENKYVSVCSLDGITNKGYESMTKYAHKHNCRIHGLGINDNRILNKVPFDSVDSSIWGLDGMRDYYYNSNIPKTKENNQKYRPLFEKRAFLKQLKRQEHYNKYWETYFKLKPKISI